MRDEGPYLLEWIAHHRAAGVTDFLIFSNNCSDGTDEMLKLLQRSRIIHHVSHEKTGGQSIQWQALKAAWKHPIRKKSDWILVSDVDEFVNIKTGNNRFEDLIQAIHPDADALVMQWRLFGHNGVVDFLDQPVTAQFTKAIPPDAAFPIAATLGKTLFRNDGPFNMLGVHRPKQKDPTKARRPIMVDGSGSFLPELYASNPDRLSLYGLPAGRDLVELNHYAIRSAAAFILKRARGLPNRKKDIGLNYWVERNFNTVEDQSISAMRPTTQTVFDELMALPGMKAMHNNAVSWHQQKFAELITVPDNQKLMTQIITAGSSEIVPKSLQSRLLAWYHEANKSS